MVFSRFAAPSFTAPAARARYYTGVLDTLPQLEVVHFLSPAIEHAALLRPPQVTETLNDSAARVLINLQIINNSTSTTAIRAARI
tara:strand:+ start:6236 stop:6490 length:255 start_codon:yes stop_codon:yes gene_type:complete